MCFKAQSSIMAHRQPNGTEIIRRNLPPVKNFNEVVKKSYETLANRHEEGGFIWLIT
jgi:hypothetical protein